MLFRNLTLFRFPASMQAAWIDLNDKLAGHPLKPVGALELSSQGFVSPFGRGMAATFALMSGELRLLLDRLDAIFCLSEAE